MRRDLTRLGRLLLVFACLAFGLCFLGVPSPAAAADKKKAWASKKHKKTHHKSSKPKAVTSKSGGGSGGAAAAATGEEDDDDESGAEDDEKQAEDQGDAKQKRKARNDDEGEREASDERGGGDDEGEGTVVRRKAKRHVAEEEGGAPVAFQLSVGPRAIHRTFNFNDPLSDHNNPAAARPYSYTLGAAPAPFLDLGFYPGAFATRGLGANVGLVARYERIVGTKTTSPNGSTFDTLGQQYELGARGRLPLGDNELGLTASYGKHTFHVSETDPGPGGTSVPNVDYSFVGLDLDGRLAVNSAVDLGAHLGSRFVLDTGSLGQTWFTTVKTTSIEAGVSLAVRLTPLFSVVGGADFLRYAFNFNPVPLTNPLVAGGAVDQYISGYAALRITLPGG